MLPLIMIIIYGKRDRCRRYFDRTQFTTQRKYNNFNASKSLKQTINARRRQRPTRNIKQQTYGYQGNSRRSSAMVKQRRPII